MKHFPTYADRTEANIISRAITGLLAAGWFLRVHDGEEFAFVEPTRDRAKIEAECFATDYTCLVVYRPDTLPLYRRVGQVDFVHGNGCDVLSDYTDREDLRAALKSADDYANGGF